MPIDFTDTKWRFEERVTRLMNKGRTREEAEEIVRHVIETKEGPHCLHLPTVSIMGAPITCQLCGATLGIAR